MGYKILYLVVIFRILALSAQDIQKPETERKNIYHKENSSFNYKTLIIPSVFIGYGIIGLKSSSLKLYDFKIKNKIQKSIDSKITVDNFSQYAPALSVYALNVLGVKGKHNLKDRTVILGTSMLFVGMTVNGLKYSTGVERPDGSARNSFPSGHTAVAFAGAEFLWQEYKDISIWYGITGYMVATGTGFFRMYNNRHWFTDVVAGAGFGILSTKAAYWIHPLLNKKIFNKKASETTSMLAPFYNGRETGVSFVMAF